VQKCAECFCTDYLFDCAATALLAVSLLLQRLPNTSAVMPECKVTLPGVLQVLLNVLADEIHRAHQRCSQEGVACDPTNHKMELVFEAGVATMKLLKRAYSCISMIAGVGLIAFRDPFGIRYLTLLCLARMSKLACVVPKRAMLTAALAQCCHSHHCLNRPLWYHVLFQLSVFVGTLKPSLAAMRQQYVLLWNQRLNAMHTFR